MHFILDIGRVSYKVLGQIEHILPNFSSEMFCFSSRLYLLFPKLFFCVCVCQPFLILQLKKCNNKIRKWQKLNVFSCRCWPPPRCSTPRTLRSSTSGTCTCSVQLVSRVGSCSRGCNTSARSRRCPDFAEIGKIKKLIVILLSKYLTFSLLSFETYY